jgi:glyoxylase-like metal-dependent hydrolase (beta-lactamase superfamily II)
MGSNQRNFWLLFPVGGQWINRLLNMVFTDDDVFMTHLHFDHCGGSVQWNKDKTGYEPFQER